MILTLCMSRLLPIMMFSRHVSKINSHKLTRLDVSVHDASVVQILDSFKQRFDDRRCFKVSERHVHLPSVLDDLVQRAVFDKLLNDA